MNNYLDGTRVSRAENIYQFRRVHMHGTKTGPNADPDYAERYHPGKLGPIKNLPLRDRLQGFMDEYKERTIGGEWSAWRMHEKYPVKIMLGIGSPRDHDVIKVSGLESLDPTSEEPYATMVLEEGLDLADKWHVELWQLPAAYDPIEGDDLLVGRDYLGWEALREWYLKNGFVKSGGFFIYYPGSRK